LIGHCKDCKKDKTKKRKRVADVSPDVRQEDTLNVSLDEAQKRSRAPSPELSPRLTPELPGTYFMDTPDTSMDDLCAWLHGDDELQNVNI
jgi:hypothetical protein